ncbi:MAG: sensor histidine kinase [Sulfurifustis sp.]
MQHSQSEVQREAKSKGQLKRDSRRGDTAAEQHGAVRFAEGLDTIEIIAEYRALRASVIRLWTAKENGLDCSSCELTRFNEGIDQALTESITVFSTRLNRSRELLMGVLGHDLRNPLNAVIQSAQLLAMYPDIKGKPRQAVECILRSGRRAEGLVVDLLDVARTRLGGELPLAPTETDLRDVCREAVEEARAHHRDRAIVLRFEGDITGKWDRARLMQLASNLIENGLTHGGDKAIVDVTAQGDQDWIVLKVHNGGAAISASVLHRVFDVLVQDDEHAHGPHERSSLGLGLYICRVVAEAHGGSIEVASSAREGTTFTVFLPRHPERMQTPQRVRVVQDRTN